LKAAEFCRWRLAGAVTVARRVSVVIGSLPVTLMSPGRKTIEIVQSPSPCCQEICQGVGKEQDCFAGTCSAQDQIPLAISIRCAITKCCGNEQHTTLDRLNGIAQCGGIIRLSVTLAWKSRLKFHLAGAFGIPASPAW